MRPIKWLLLTLIVVATGCERVTPQQHVDRASEHVASGELTSAVIELKNALQKDPEYAVARLALGELYLVTSDYPAALKELERALDLGVEREVVIAPLSIAKLRLGRYQEVLGTLGSLGELNPDMLALRGEALRQAGDVDGARQCFDDALSRDASVEEAYLGLVKLALSQNDRDAAGQYVARGLATIPKSRQLWILKGDIAAPAGDLETALNAFQTADSLPGGDAIPQLGIARVHIDQGNLDEATATLDAVLRKSPKQPFANYLKAVVAYQRGDMDVAEAALQLVGLAAPDFAQSTLLMGMVKSRQAQYAQADSLLSRYVAQHPDDMQARQILAAVRLASNDGKGAADALSPIRDLLVDARTLALLGVANLQAGDASEAVTVLRRAAAEAPDEPLLRHDLAQSLLVAGQTDAAISELQTAIELDPDQVQSQELLIAAHIEKKQFEEAYALAVQLLERNPNNANVYNLKGVALLGLDDPEKGRRALEQALTIDPTFDPAAINLMKLDLKEGNKAAAKAHVERLLAADPSSEAARMALAQLALDNGDVDTAREHLQAARSQHSGSLAPRILLANLSINAGDLQLADSVTEEAVRIAPDNPEALLLRATVIQSLRGPQAAASYVRRLEEIIPAVAPPQLFARLGALQQIVGRLDQAARSYEHALTGMPNATPVRAALIQTRLAQNNVVAAREQLAALRAANAPPSLIDQLDGDVAAKSGNLDDAASAYRRSADLGSREGLLRLHELEVGRDRPEAADAALAAWLGVHPGDEQVELKLAILRGQQGDEDGARVLYERIQQRNPDNMIVLNNLAGIYLRAGDERAEPTARRAHELAPDNPAVADTLGWILVDQGRLEEGTPLLERAAATLEDNATAQYHLAVAYERAKRDSEARDVAQRALRLGAFPERKETEALLQRVEAAVQETIVRE